jgi:hypothetical protein
MLSGRMAHYYVRVNVERYPLFDVAETVKKFLRCNIGSAASTSCR